MNTRDKIAAMMGPTPPPHADAPQGRVTPAQPRNKANADLLQYYLGGTGLAERLGLLNDTFNPVAAIGSSMEASQRMFAPETSGWGRVGAAGEMLSGVAGAVAPMVAASRVGGSAADALVDSMTGISMGAKSAAGDFAADEYGGVGFGGKVDARGAEIMAMLQAGRGGDVTDAMLDMGDATETARLNEWLFNNYDLPMDAGSRASRSADMGLSDQIHYHGARAPFSGFEPSSSGMQGPGVYVTQIAEDASGYALDHGVEGQNGLEVLIPRGKYASDSDVSTATFSRFRNDRLPDYKTANAAGVADLQGQGYVGAAVENSRRQFFGDENPVGVVQRNVFDPSRLRSRFARFDPRLAHLRNLSAGVAGGGLMFGGDEE